MRSEDNPHNAAAMWWLCSPIEGARKGRGREAEKSMGVRTWPNVPRIG